MSKKQNFNPVPLILIGVTSGSFAVISVFFINWKGAVIEQTNSPKQPVQITLPTTPTITEQPVEKTEKIKQTETTYQATVFVPKYQPILPNGSSTKVTRLALLASGGGRDCLLRDWKLYTTEPTLMNGMCSLANRNGKNNHDGEFSDGYLRLSAVSRLLRFIIYTIIYTGCRNPYYRLRLSVPAQTRFKHTH